MTQEAKEITPDGVQLLVQNYLNDAFSDEREWPQIIDERIAVDGKWWTVPVFSPLKKTNRFNDYDRLADVEVDLLKNEGIDIELIPASPRAA